MENTELTLDEKLKKNEEEFNALFKRRTEDTYRVEFNTSGYAKKLLKEIQSIKIEWAGNEAVGYKNVVETLMTSLDSESKEMFLDLKAYLIEGLNYFLTRKKGNGYYEAKNYSEIVEPLFKTVIQMRKDDDKLKELRNEMDTLKIEIDLANQPQRQQTINEVKNSEI